MVEKKTSGNSIYKALLCQIALSWEREDNPLSEDLQGFTHYAKAVADHRPGRPPPGPLRARPPALCLAAQGVRTLEELL